MLKPSDVPQTTLPGVDSAQRAQIQTHIDEALAMAGHTGVWPCRVQALRSGWLTRNVSAVLSAYSDLGWRVTNHHEGSTMVIIDRPATTEADSEEKETKYVDIVMERLLVAPEFVLAPWERWLRSVVSPDGLLDADRSAAIRELVGLAYRRELLR